MTLVLGSTLKHESLLYIAGNVGTIVGVRQVFMGRIFKNHSQLILEPTFELVVSLSLRVYATPCPLL
jgi:hypothetical protein